MLNLKKLLTNILNKIDSLNSKSPSTTVDISSYNSSTNTYAAVTDGYVQLQGNNSRLVLEDGSSVIQSTGTLVGMYIKRGMNVYVIGSPTLANFIPLS